MHFFLIQTSDETVGFPLSWKYAGVPLPSPTISIWANQKIEIGGITHERNQSAGLLPVLYER